MSRYYHDFQIFLNRVDPSLEELEIKQYFEQFGEVLDVVLTESLGKKEKLCYIKMKDDHTVDRIVLGKLHKISGKEVKPARTYGLHEEKETDKKLFLKIDGSLDSSDDF